MSPSASALGYNRVKASKVTHLSDAEAISLQHTPCNKLCYEQHTATQGVRTGSDAGLCLNTRWWSFQENPLGLRRPWHSQMIQQCAGGTTLCFSVRCPMTAETIVRESLFPLPARHTKWPRGKEQDHCDVPKSSFHGEKGSRTHVWYELIYRCLCLYNCICSYAVFLKKNTFNFNSTYFWNEETVKGNLNI